MGTATEERAVACDLLRASRPQPSESFFESLPRRTLAIPVENGSCYESYSGSFFAACRKSSPRAALRFPARPGLSASYYLQASCLSLAREPHAGRHDCKTVETSAKKAAEISAIERQKNICRCQRAKENRSVLLHRKHGGLVDRQDIIDDNELAPQPQPRCGDRCREGHEIADCLRDGIGCRHQ